MKRVVLIATGILVALVAGVFSTISWDRASQVASVLSAVIAIVSLSATIIQIIPTGHSAPISVKNSGSARANNDGIAISEVFVTDVQPVTNIEIDRSGSAIAENTGQAISGIMLSGKAVESFRPLGTGELDGR